MKKLLSLPLGFILSFAPLSFAFAQKDQLCPKDTTSTGGANFSTLCTLNSTNIGRTLGNVITFIFVIVTIVALLYLIWGGFKWLISGGDSKAVDTARGHIVAAIIGLIIIFLAYFILNVVVGFFIPGFSLSNISIPNITQ